jgi:hypothetical protein
MWVEIFERINNLRLIKWVKMHPVKTYSNTSENVIEIGSAIHIFLKE